MLKAFSATAQLWQLYPGLFSGSGKVNATSHAPVFFRDLDPLLDMPEGLEAHDLEGIELMDAMEQQLEEHGIEQSCTPPSWQEDPARAAEPLGREIRYQRFWLWSR